CSSFQGMRFDPLPGAAEEAAEVSSLWSGVSKPDASVPGNLLLTGAAASEAVFKQSAPRFRILHLATHAFFLEDDGAPPSAPASDGRASVVETPAGRQLTDNPLLLTGLALAGANRRAEAWGLPDAEDGILTAEEIASLDLSQVQWVVLSGCDTGAGKVVSG